MSTFTYQGTTYELVGERVTFAEARAIEKFGGVTMAELGANQGRADVLQALVWVSMKRKDPTLKFSDLDDIDISDIDFQDDVPEADPTAAETDSLVSA